MFASALGRLPDLHSMEISINCTNISRDYCFEEIFLQWEISKKILCTMSTCTESMLRVRNWSKNRCKAMHKITIMETEEEHEWWNFPENFPTLSKVPRIISENSQKFPRKFWPSIVKNATRSTTILVVLSQLTFIFAQKVTSDIISRTFYMRSISKKQKNITNHDRNILTTAL